VTLDTKGAGSTTEARVNGMIAGFEEACGKIDAAKFRSLDVGGTTDLAVTKFGDQLSALAPGGIIVVLSLNDDMSLGAFAAARTAGREKELRLAGQGADPTSWKEIACNPQWLADTAYFPERYGEILIPAVVKLLNGETVEKNLFTQHDVVTKDNVRTLYPDTPAC
jgi:ribose transport system substrate-binding protein